MSEPRNILFPEEKMRWNCVSVSCIVVITCYILFQIIANSIQGSCRSHRRSLSGSKTASICVFTAFRIKINIGGNNP